MNEVLAPIYYVFKLDATADFSAEAEVWGLRFKV